MEKDANTPRSIEGDWDWREISVNRPDGWAVLEENRGGKHIWSFIGDKTMAYEEGEHLRYMAEYRYDPDNLSLAIDGFRLDDRGEPEAKIRQRYRMEFPAPSEMYLYELTDAESGGEELRLAFRKI